MRPKDRFDARDAPSALSAKAITRRTFIKRNAGLILWSAALCYGVRLPRPAGGAEIPDIAMATGERTATR